MKRAKLTWQTIHGVEAGSGGTRSLSIAFLSERSLVWYFIFHPFSFFPTSSLSLKSSMKENFSKTVMKEIKSFITLYSQKQLDKVIEQCWPRHCNKTNLKTQTKITKIQTKTKWRKSPLFSAAKFIAFQNPNLKH